MTLSIFTSSPSSTLFFGLFIVLTLATLAIKCWLSWRQIRSVKQHRAHVPVDFTGHVTLSSHQRAADYTVAQQRFGMLESAWSTLLLLGWTVFGGLNLLNHIV